MVFKLLFEHNMSRSYNNGWWLRTPLSLRWRSHGAWKGLKSISKRQKKKTFQSTFTIFHLFTFMPFKFLHFTFLAIYFLHFIIVVLSFFSSIMLPINKHAWVKQLLYTTILRKCFSKSFSPFSKRMKFSIKKKKGEFFQKMLC